ncbi:hypothetical protein E1262_21345 [Jiangella aurantiaca]|uniref:DUF308 domain-containing protein n=1 Tax=Jiangella aurantiaca TaxID=2530373 RepID=A0A4R5A493_9ACTN|nr:hypothetical protein [Jiangella aurantiaca]TDD66723.1 hypothetical protein E1262_21345 [Jiangella aurantiaca]
MSRDDDQTWAELIDSFHAAPSDGDQPWPAAEELGPDDGLEEGVRPDDFRDASVTLGSLTERGAAPDPPVEAPASGGIDDAAAEEAANHFVPPVPAPIPRGDRIQRLAWAAVIAPPIALIIVAIMSWRPSDEIVLFAVVAFVAGFVTLVARMRGHHPNDPDDGAVI